MTAQHSLDPTRLELLRQQRDAARAASMSAHEAALEEHRQLGVVQQELRRFTEMSDHGVVIMDHRALAEKRAELRAKVEKLEASKADLFAKYEMLAERGRASAVLHSRCAEFVGVDPNAR